MYTWKLVSHDTSQDPLCTGVGADLALIMRTVEKHLLAPLGFVGLITEVVPRMSVFHLGAIHVPTGREWLGRRDRNDGVYWEARHRPVDPDVAYDLAETRDPGAVTR